MAKLTLTELEQLARAVLEDAGVSADTALVTAKALVWADARGLSTHGVARLPLYLAHLRNGRVDGRAHPQLIKDHGAVAVVDAGNGLAYPALCLAAHQAIDKARRYGLGLAGVVHSNHHGASVLNLAPVAEAGMVGLLFGNSPAAIAPWGGSAPVFGTNPIAAVFPRAEGDAIAVDLALTQVTRGRIMLAAQQGQTIPDDWALDRDGQPTTDPDAALLGSLFPAGGSKGAVLALVVEILIGALLGAGFSFEAASFFSEQGTPAHIGQLILVIDPDALAGRAHYLQRLEQLVLAVLEQPGVRLPGSRREALAREAQADGVDIPDALLARLQAALALAHTELAT